MGSTGLEGDFGSWGHLPSDQSDGVQNDKEDDEQDDGDHDPKNYLLLSRRSPEVLGLVQVALPRLHVGLRPAHVHSDVVDLRFGYIITIEV